MWLISIFKGSLYSILNSYSDKLLFYIYITTDKFELLLLLKFNIPVNDLDTDPLGILLVLLFNTLKYFYT